MGLVALPRRTEEQAAAEEGKRMLLLLQLLPQLLLLLPRMRWRPKSLPMRHPLLPLPMLMPPLLLLLLLLLLLRSRSQWRLTDEVREKEKRRDF